MSSLKDFGENCVMCSFKIFPVRQKKQDSKATKLYLIVGMSRAMADMIVSILRFSFQYRKRSKPSKNSNFTHD